MDLLIRTSTIGAHTVLSLSGEIDLATLPRLADALSPVAEVLGDDGGVVEVAGAAEAGAGDVVTGRPAS